VSGEDKAPLELLAGIPAREGAGVGGHEAGEVGVAVLDLELDGAEKPRGSEATGAAATSSKRKLSAAGRQRIGQDRRSHASAGIPTDQSV
jgi:hypothetical protein